MSETRRVVLLSGLLPMLEKVDASPSVRTGLNIGARSRACNSLRARAALRSTRVASGRRNFRPAAKPARSDRPRRTRGRASPSPWPRLGRAPRSVETRCGARLGPRQCWCRHPDSNWGPTAYKAVALPTELCRHGANSSSAVRGGTHRGARAVPTRATVRGDAAQVQSMSVACSAAAALVLRRAAQFRSPSAANSIQ
jgi:hypothetical protein